MVDFEDGFGRSSLRLAPDAVDRTTFALQGLETQMKEVEKLGGSFARAFSNAFQSAVIGGEKFDKVLAKLALSVSRISLNAALKPLESGIGSLFSSALSGVSGFSKGGAVVPFRKGGVISAPISFPLGRGLGLAGESGPEAILPLARGTGGRLGVTMNGSAGVTVNFSVNANDAESFMRSESQLAAMLSRVVSRGNRNL